MFKTKLKFTHLITAVILTLGLSVSFQSLLAGWTAPTANPPDGNVGELLNSGPEQQSKTGNLGIGGNLVVLGNLIADSWLGVNNISPAYDLDVNGDINFTGDLYQGGNLFVTGYWTQDNTDIYYDEDPGRVSVNGGNNFGAQLAVYQTTDGLIGPENYNFGLAVINTDNNSRTVIWNDANGKARISGSNDGNDEDAPIILNGSGSGWVGIGTDDVRDRLTVKNGAGFFMGDGTGANQMVAAFGTDSSGWGNTHPMFQVWTDDATDDRFELRSERWAGNVYFTRQDGDSTIHNMVRLGTSAGTHGIDIYNSSNNAAVKLNAGGNSYFNGGNVGIGTNNPGTNRLEVVGGPIKATGGLIIETRVSDPAAPAVGQMWLIQ